MCDDWFNALGLRDESAQAPCPWLDRCEARCAQTHPYEGRDVHGLARPCFFGRQTEIESLLTLFRVSGETVDSGQRQRSKLTRSRSFSISPRILYFELRTESSAMGHTFGIPLVTVSLVAWSSLCMAPKSGRWLQVVRTYMNAQPDGF